MTRDRTIVLVTTSFPIRGDGSEAAGSFVSDLAEELARHGPVRVVAPGAASLRESWTPNVDVFRFAAPEKPLSTLKPWKPAEMMAIGRVFAAGARATRQAADAGPTAHILALWALPSGYWARRVSHKTGISYSVWTLGSDIWTLGRIPVVKSLLHRILRGAHACYSDGLQLAADTRRIAGREVEFLPSTRRIERRRTAALKTSPPYRLLFLGRWHPNKGVDLLVDALRLLEDADWQRIESIEICGGGPLEDLVRSGVEALRAAGRPVELRGYLDKVAAENAILGADYLLIPSRIESIPVVFSDAVKLGCPVLASPVGDLPKLIDQTPACGMTAMGVSAGDFAAVIQKALVRPAPEFAPGLAAMASRFDLEATAARIRALAGARSE